MGAAIGPCQAKLLVSLARHAGLKAPAIGIHVARQTARTVRSSSAYQQYWTGIVRARDALGKFTFVPTVETATAREPERGPKYLSEDWRARQLAGPLEFRLEWIRFLSERETPLADLTAPWQDGHRVVVGTVTFPKSDPTTRQARLTAGNLGTVTLHTRREVRMRPWISGIAAVVLLVAGPAQAQESRPFGLEAGVVMGIIGVPYPTIGVVAGPWSVRVSGGRGPGLVNCHGLQLNAGRVLREQGNAKHTIGMVWADFHHGCWSDNAYPSSRNRESGGRYYGLAYDFQAKGFFIEAGPAFGASNPFSSTFTGGIFNHIYGQLGYLHRFGKKYRDDDEDR